MKTIIALVLVVAAQVSNAAINHSNLEERHQTLIEQAIYNNCGHSGQVTQLNNVEDVINVDNGIRDVKYTTTLQVRVGIDQYMYDEYTVIVKSEFADMYDHNTQNWGVYSVENVFCYAKQ